MENYELSSDNIKEIDRVVSQVKVGLEGLKSKLNGVEDSSKENENSEKSQEEKQVNTVENNGSFYEINENKATLKMDIVKSYLDMIKNKEWSDLKSDNGATWIMAVQIALRSTQIGGENHNKYGEIVIDGILGPMTKEAVRKFQEENGLEPDGLPGKNTLSKIYDILDGRVSVDNSKNTATESNIDSTTGGTAASGASTEVSKESNEKEPENSKIVSVKDYVKDVKLDMRYATTNNFTGQKIYEDADAKLRYGTIKKLKVAQDELMSKGYSIKIWDAYRPNSAQTKLRNIRPDATLVAKPYNPSTGKGGSNHTRGNAIDVTLVKSDGTEIPMPSEFDDSNKKKVDRNYSDLTEEQRTNAKILEDAMKRAGFIPYTNEWWHFTDSNKYPMEKGD